MPITDKASIYGGCITAGGCFEMDVVGETLWYNIRVGIGFLFPLIVPLGVGDFGSGQVYISSFDSLSHAPDVRFMAFSNGDLEALYDKSEGFFRRQLILQTRRKPPGRVDDPFLSDKLKQEAEGIFLWCLDGLKRLQSNNYRFTVSQRAADNKEHAKRNANNLVEFLQSEGYIQMKADSTITSRELYSIYQMWCEDNGYRPIAQRSVSSYLKSHLEDYNLEASNKIINKSGKQVRKD